MIAVIAVFWTEYVREARIEGTKKIIDPMTGIEARKPAKMLVVKANSTPRIERVRKVAIPIIKPRAT